MVKLIKVARLQFLIAGLALFLLGALVAADLGAPLSMGRLLLGYVVIAAAQLSVHFSNDYFDAMTDMPGGPTLISGGGGVLLEHPELRLTVRRAGLGLLCFSVGAGVLFVILFSYPLWTMGLVLAANLLGWFYSAPPISMSRNGWGEVCYAFIAGLLLPGVGYLTARGTLDVGGLFFVPALLSYGFVSILSVEIPDLEADHAGGKHTWIERWGRRATFMVIGLLMAAATTYFFLLPRFFAKLPLDGRVLGWLSLLPLAPGLAGLLVRPAARPAATRIATVNVVALAIFALLVDAYLFSLIRR